MADQDKTKAQLWAEIAALRQQVAALEARDAEHRQIAAKYQTLIEQLPAITYVVGLHNINRTTYISPQVEELLGFSPEEWLAEPDLWARLIHPEDRERVLAEVAYRDASGEPFDLEYRTFARDGSIHWLHNRYMVVRGQQTRYLHGVMFDITERKLAQRQAEDRAKELATLNQINQMVSSAQDLPAVLAVVAKELVQIFKARNSGITLLNAARTEMTVVADHSLDPTEPSAVGIVIPVVGNPSSSRVIETRQSLMIPHAQTDPLTQSIHPILKARNTHCLLIIPLLSQGDVIGTIGLDSTDPDRIFSPEEVRFAETIAGQIAGVVDMTRLLNQAQEQRRIAESLQQVAAVVNASLDIDVVLNNILQQLRQVVEYDSATILLHEGDTLVITNGVNLSEPENTIAHPIPLSSNSPGVRVFRQREPLIIADVQKDPNWFNLPGMERIHGWMGIPLLAGDKAIGILAVDNMTVGAYCPLEAQVGQTFANQAAIAIENARLYRGVTDRTKELSQALEDLKIAQNQLVEAEKMASLGSLVAGVAHEINTPIGIGVTAASTLAHETERFVQQYQTGRVKRSVLDEYVSVAQESSQLLLRNLRRAVELIQSFKQVAVDQTNLEKREFLVKAYLEEIVRSLQPQLKHTRHIITVEGDETIKMTSYPGALSQVITNLVLNSLAHAFANEAAGTITCNLFLSNSRRLMIEYADNGCGIPPENLPKIFDPFFTTARGHGGTGLGLHIVYNLVTQTLEGIIRCESKVNQGTKFFLDLPLKINRKDEHGANI